VKILAVSHAYPSRTASGHGIFVHRLHQGLVAAGADVHVLQLVDWSPPWPLELALPDWRQSAQRRRALHARLDGIAVHHPAVFTPRPSRFFSGDPWQRQVDALVDYCAGRPELRGADVVLGHFLVPDGYHALRLGRALSLPVAAIAWGDDVHAWPEERATWREKLEVVLAEIDLPIACSERMARDANTWLASPRSDWHVVYGGVDTDAFHPPTDRAADRARAFANWPSLRGEGARVLLMLGQRVRAKGYAELLDAWSNVSPEAPGWHLAMAGADWGDFDVVREIEARGLGETAHWLGLYPGEEIAALLRASDAFVLPSHNEGLSLSLLEAMATGLPCIATDVGGHAEAIRQAGEGWLIPPRDTAALERALRELTAPDAPRQAIGRCARSAAERIGSPAQNARRLLGALETLAVGVH
jgi:glycosyltransferase involved in cell wall biosynthesis